MRKAKEERRQGESQGALKVKVRTLAFTLRGPLAGFEQMSDLIWLRF